MKFLIPSLLFLGTTLATSAATLESKDFNYSLKAGESAHNSLKCTSGAVLSGGYTLDNFTPTAFELSVILNAPQPGGYWRVDILNISTHATQGKYWISVLCG